MRPKKKSKRIAQGELTRNRILDAAERMFAEEGPGISARKIAAASNVDLALLMYHFKSKEGLYRAVFERHIRGTSQTQRDNIARLLESKEPPSVRDVLTVAIIPWLQGKSGRDFSLLLAREVMYPTDPKIVEEFVDPVTRDLISLMQVALLPRMKSAERIHWAFHTVSGMLFYITSASHRIRRLSKGICSMSSTEDLLESLLVTLEPLFMEREQKPPSDTGAKNKKRKRAVSVAKRLKGA